MRVPLIIGGVAAVVIAVLAFVFGTLVGFGSPSTMSQNAKLFGAHWSEVSALGFPGVLTDSWLWARCVRTTGLAANPVFQRSFLTDKERNCGKSALHHAEALMKEKGWSRQRKEIAVGWYRIADQLSEPGDFTSQVAFAEQILNGEVPADAFAGNDISTARSGAVLTILVAAWHDDAKAMVKATDLLLQGSTPVEKVGMPPAIEAYALLLQAKAKGEDVDDRLSMVSLLIDTPIRFEVQDWLKSTGRLPD